MILSFSMYEKSYLQGSLGRVLEAIKVSNLERYPHDCLVMRKRRNVRVVTRLVQAP